MTVKMNKEEIVRFAHTHEEHLPALPDALELLVSQSSGLALAIYGDGVQLVETGRHKEIP